MRFPLQFQALASLKRTGFDIRHTVRNPHGCQTSVIINLCLNRQLDEKQKLLFCNSSYFSMQLHRSVHFLLSDAEQGTEKQFRKEVQIDNDLY